MNAPTTPMNLTSLNALRAKYTHEERLRLGLTRAEDDALQRMLDLGGELFCALSLSGHLLFEGLKGLEERGLVSSEAAEIWGGGMHTERLPNKPALKFRFAGYDYSGLSASTGTDKRETASRRARKPRRS